VIIRLTKLFAPCVKCGSKDAVRNYTPPQIGLLASGVAVMARIHKCKSCGAVFAGPDEAATLTDILKWVVDTKTLTMNERGITVLIEHGGGPVAEIYIEKHKCGGGVCYRKTAPDGVVDGEVTTNDEDGSWDVLGKVIEDIKKRGVGKDERE
jgi:hypothetical protein